MAAQQLATPLSSGPRVANHAPRTRTAARTCRLTEVKVGRRARMYSHELAAQDLQLLEAIGLTARSEIRVLQQGEPCIVQVRDTRVGLTAPVAACMRVEPLDPS